MKTSKKKNIFKLCSIQRTIKSGYLNGALSFFFIIFFFFKITSCAFSCLYIYNQTVAPQPSQIVGSSRPYCRQTCHFISFHKKKANSTKRTPKWVSTERARHASISMLMLCLLTQELTTISFEHLTVLNIELSWINILCPLSISLAGFISNLIAGLKGWTKGWRLRSVWQPGSLLPAPSNWCVWNTLTTPTGLNRSCVLMASSGARPSLHLLLPSNRSFLRSSSCCTS